MSHLKWRSYYLPDNLKIFFPDFYETTELKGFVKSEVTQVHGKACVLTTLFDPFSVSYV